MQKYVESHLKISTLSTVFLKLLTIVTSKGQ